MNRRLRQAGLRLVAAGLALLIAACAQTPTEPVSSLPDKVIRNTPSATSTAEPRPLPVPALRAPLHDELPPTPVAIGDVMDRIRAGAQLPLHVLPQRSRAPFIRPILRYGYRSESEPRL